MTQTRWQKPDDADPTARMTTANGNSAMFKILELNITSSAAPTQIGGGFATREDALMAVKRYLKSFKVSGHNSEESYWWARDSDGLRRCWISPA